MAVNAAWRKDRGIEHGISVRVRRRRRRVARRAPSQAAALYQIVREAFEGAIRRGPPKTFSVQVVSTTADDALEVTHRGRRARRAAKAVDRGARRNARARSTQSPARSTRPTTARPCGSSCRRTSAPRVSSAPSMLPPMADGHLLVRLEHVRLRAPRAGRRTIPAVGSEVETGGTTLVVTKVGPRRPCRATSGSARTSAAS